MPKILDRTKCSACGVTKTPENTNKDSSKVDGFHTRCRSCQGVSPKSKALVSAPKPRCGLVELPPSIHHPSGVFERDGHLWVSSLDVARNLEKDHDEVLRKIRGLDCTGAFNDRNFTAVEYRDGKGEMRPAYNMTRDGLIFLTSRFTGEKAAAVIENYIALFNAMENQIKKHMAIDANAMVVFEKFNAQWLDAYKHSSELISQNNRMIVVVGEKVDKVEKRCDNIEGRVTNMEQVLEPRNNIQKWDPYHGMFLVQSVLDGRCPCCERSPIASAMGFIPGTYHRDHFFGRSRHRFDECWVICIECHKKKTAGKFAEKFLGSAFQNYHSRAEEFFKRNRKHYAIVYGVIRSEVA